MPNQPQILIPHAVRQDVCPICNRNHKNRGGYRCLKCGKVICAYHSVAGCTEEVIVEHMREVSGFRFGDDPKKYEICGPAIRIISLSFSSLRLRKVKNDR